LKPAILFALSLCCPAAIIDRIAIVAGRHAILDSAIATEIRVTAFLNHETPDFSAASRKEAASRLIDQALIREQIASGDYPVAKESEAAALLAQIRADRPQYRAELARDGITEQELKDRLLWQLTVLRFIDARFRPQVVVSDEEIHRAQAGRKTDRQAIVDQLTGERVNALLDDWLKQQRSEARIEYLEKSLQ
jgi:hypothetical protein